MNKVKVLSIIIVVLTVLNIILIFFMTTGSRKGPHPEGPKNMIIEKLNFDNEQVIEYEKLIVWHRNKIRESDQSMMELKHQLYNTLISNQSVAIKDSLINEIGKMQIAVENIHYQHFQDIKKLCKPHQQKEYEELTKEISKLFSKPRNKPH